MSFKFVVLLFCLIVATRSAAENPLSRFLMMKRMHSKDKGTMKGSIFSGIFGRKKGGRDSLKHEPDSPEAFDANESDQAARAKDALSSLKKELDEAQASHESSSNKELSTEEKVNALEIELLEFRAVARLHLQRLIEAANRHQTQRIAAVVEEYDQRFSDMQKLSQNAPTDENAAMAQKNADLAALTAEYVARNDELKIQLQRAEVAQENAIKAEQEYIARLNDLEKQMKDVRANMAAEMERKTYELTALQAAYDEVTIKGQTEIELAKAGRDAAVEAEQKAIEKLKELEQAPAVIRVETTENMGEQARETGVNVTQRIAAMADAHAESENALIAMQTELMKREEDLASLKMDYEQLKYQDHHELKLVENARDSALERVLNLQRELENVLAETKTKMDEVTEEADKRVSQSIAEVESKYAQSLADAEDRAGQDLAAAKYALKVKEDALAILQAQYDEQRIASLTQLELAESAREAAVEAEQKATSKMKELEHASEVLLSETTIMLEQRINEIETNATQRINAISDARDQSERALTAATAELLEKEKVIATLMTDFEHFKSESQGKFELAENARIDALERALHLQQEYETLLEGAKNEMKEAARAADDRVAQLAIKMEQDYALILTDAQEQANHDLFDVKFELEEELAAVLVENEELKSRVAEALLPVKDLEAAAQVRCDEIISVAMKKKDEEITALAAKLNDAHTLHDEQLAASRDGVKVTEEQIAKLNEKFDEANARYRQELNVTVLELEKNKLELAALQVEYKETQSQSERDIVVAQEEGKKMTVELIALMGRYDKMKSQSDEYLAEARAQLQLAREGLAVVRAEYENAQTSAVQELLEVKDTLHIKERDLVDLKAEYNDAIVWYDQELVNVREEARRYEREISSLIDERDQKYCDAEGRELVALKTAYNEEEARCDEEAHIATLAGVDSKWEELEGIRDEDRAEAKSLESEPTAANSNFQATLDDKETLEIEAEDLKADSGSSSAQVADFDVKLVEIEARLHTSVLLSDSSETSAPLLLSEGRQNVDTIAAQPSPSYKRQAAIVLHGMTESLSARVGINNVYIFFLNGFDKIVVFVQINCPLIESDVQVTAPLWVHESVREACLEPREAVACFFQVECMIIALLMRRRIWSLLKRMVFLFFHFIFFFSPTRLIGSRINSGAMKEHVGRRLRGSPKKRAQ